MARSALRGESLRVVVGGVELLSGVDITVEAGEIFGVLGPNGAGKSTLLRVLAGELAPSSGRVFIGEEDVTGLPLWKRARRGLGYVPQTPSVLFDLTVEDNIRTFERAAGARSEPPRERAEAFALESKLGVLARDLSGGERRTLEILRATIGAPKVLLCDEPFAAGDPVRSGVIARHLRTIAERGGALLITDHRLADTLDTCDRAILLVGGSVELIARASEFSDHPAVRRRYLR